MMEREWMTTTFATRTDAMDATTASGQCRTATSAVAGFGTKNSSKSMSCAISRLETRYRCHGSLRQ